MNKLQAIRITGGLSSPGKMPCHGYGIPAQSCKVGSQLHQVKGSVCYGCYALKGNYRFRNVQAAQGRRLRALRRPDWANGMVFLILDSGDRYFRWHDSGDLQGVWHLEKIVDVCLRTPQVQHWLPTREYRMVLEFLKGGGRIPDNLTIRLSAHMVDGAPPSGHGIQTSTVNSFEPGDPRSTAYNPLPLLNGIPQGTHYCRAGEQGNKCLSCRVCWDPRVKNVSYRLH